MRRTRFAITCPEGVGFYSLSVCLFYFSAPTRPRAPTTRPNPPLTAVIYALPPPQPGNPPATAWAPGRPPPSWGVHAQQNGTLGNRARPSTQRVHLGSRKTQFSVVRTGSRPSVSPLRSIECQHLHSALGSLVKGTALLSVIAQEFHRATQRCMAPL